MPNPEPTDLLIGLNFPPGGEHIGDPTKGRDSTFQKIVPPNEILVFGCLSDLDVTVVFELAKRRAVAES